MHGYTGSVTDKLLEYFNVMISIRHQIFLFWKVISLADPTGDGVHSEGPRTELKIGRQDWSVLPEMSSISSVSSMTSMRTSARFRPLYDNDHETDADSSKESLDGKSRITLIQLT